MTFDLNHTPEQRLAALGLVLPLSPTPAGLYRPARLVGDTLYLAGQGPRHADGSFVTGRLGADATLEQGRMAARDAGLRLLSVAQAALGGLSRVVTVARVAAVIHAVPEYEDHAAVLDGCSDLFSQVFGEAGQHVRSVTGSTSMPFGMILQIDAIFHVSLASQEQSK